MRYIPETPTPSLPRQTRTTCWSPSYTPDCPSIFLRHSRNSGSGFFRPDSHSIPPYSSQVPSAPAQTASSDTSDAGMPVRCNSLPENPLPQAPPHTRCPWHRSSLPATGRLTSDRSRLHSPHKSTRNRRRLRPRASHCTSSFRPPRPARPHSQPVLCIPLSPQSRTFPLPSAHKHLFPCSAPPRLSHLHCCPHSSVPQKNPCPEASQNPSVYNRLHHPTSGSGTMYTRLILPSHRLLSPHFPDRAVSAYPRSPVRCAPSPVRR